MNAEPQFLRSENGDELVVLSRRAYDALLARAGDEAAEDRMTERMTEDFLAAKARGEAALIPAWFVELTIRHGSAVAAARRHAGLTQPGLARRLGVPVSDVRAIERGLRVGTAEFLNGIAAATAVEAAWLAD